MAAFHLRNIPDELYKRLRERARKKGRSTNAELLSILERELSRPDPGEFMRRLDELRSRMILSPDAPKPEDLIRVDRDSDHGSL
jgi:plasmid stability protein